MYVDFIGKHILFRFEMYRMIKDFLVYVKSHYCEDLQYLQMSILIANNGDSVIVRKWCSHEITCSRHFTRRGGREWDSKKILQIRIWFSKCSWHLFYFSIYRLATCTFTFIYKSLVTMKRENWCFKSDNCSAWSILIKLLIGYIVSM